MIQNLKQATTFIAPMLISMVAILIYATIYIIDPKLTRHLGLDFLFGSPYNFNEIN